MDLDYFYAQVEEVENPVLKGRPIIVCVFSGRTEDSGAVATANYMARELGVHSGMPIAQAKRKLQGTDAAVIKMNHSKYELISARVMEGLERAVDVLEPTGIDEAFFDLTISTAGDYQRARKSAEAIKGAILQSERLTCSIGIGKSKAVAKLGSDMAKPGGLTVIEPSATRAFLEPLPVAKLYGVGPKTSSELAELRISTIGDLADADPTKLERRFGKRFGAYLLAAATGADLDPVVADLEPAQFSRIVTLKRDTRNPREAFEQLSQGVDYVHRKLVSSSKSCRTISAIGILADLTAKTKSKTFETPVNDLSTIQETTLVLLEELNAIVDRDFRRVGLRVSGLVNVEDQTSLSEFLGPMG